VAHLTSKQIKIDIDRDHTVSGIWMRPRGATACLVLAHGAGAGMNHPFMLAITKALATEGIATLRYQFPYMESGRKRTDFPHLCHATVRAAVAAARRLGRQLPLFAGGKSFGGRMTSQAQAASPLPDVRGLIFLGFPLHPAKRPSNDRGRHLLEISIPMIFLQGTRDALAEPKLMRRLIRRISRCARLTSIQHADHSFHAPVRSGRTDDDIQDELAAAIATWLLPLAGCSKIVQMNPSR